jgi:LAO/AO transport system kinase
MVETDSPQLRELARALLGQAGRAHIVGLTGAPGVGKSTSTAELVSALRRTGRQVGVLAVDPSSPFSGGAFLGDRIRMQEHATDPSVFIRSMASRGHLGGLAAAVPQALRVLEAAGCDVILIETVGVGQSEIDIAALADTTLVLIAPGAGDGIQAAKAGILEIADLFVINKADREGAQATRRQVRSVLGTARRDSGGWEPPIVLTVATSGDGIDELIAQIDAHGSHLAASGEGDRRRQERARREIEALALERVRRDFAARSASEIDALAAKVAAGATDPFSAADQLTDGR